MGGIGLEYSLLTMHFLLTDDNFNTLSELSLSLKPDNGIYHVCAEAMEINKIDLVKHDKIAIPYKKAKTDLYNWLNLRFLENNSEKIVPVGHGFSGDLEQIFDKLVARKTWETFVSYRRLDTSVALQFLKTCGTFPSDVSGSLESLAIHFGINHGTLHDARTDVLVTRDVIKEMIKLINPFKNNNP
jgi:hypothetical protein